MNAKLGLSLPPPCHQTSAEVSRAPPARSVRWTAAAAGALHRHTRASPCALSGGFPEHRC